MITPRWWGGPLARPPHEERPFDHILPAKADVARDDHHASLPYAEMPMSLRLQVQDGIRPRLEFAILTACRTAEVLGARWDEIDIDGRLWTLPPDE